MKTKTHENIKTDSVVRPVREDPCELNFRGIKMESTALRDAWKKAYNKIKPKKHVRIPKLEVYVIHDEDYERLHNKRPDTSISFSRVYWEKTITEPDYAFIFIRASVCLKDMITAQEALRGECQKLLTLWTFISSAINDNGFTTEQLLKLLTPDGDSELYVLNENQL